jgi:hypothetical protein
MDKAYSWPAMKFSDGIEYEVEFPISIFVKHTVFMVISRNVTRYPAAPGAAPHCDVTPLSAFTTRF